MFLFLQIKCIVTIFLGCSCCIFHAEGFFFHLNVILMRPVLEFSKPLPFPCFLPVNAVISRKDELVWVFCFKWKNRIVAQAHGDFTAKGISLNVSLYFLQSLGLWTCPNSPLWAGSLLSFWEALIPHVRNNHQSQIIHFRLQRIQFLLWDIPLVFLLEAASLLRALKGPISWGKN